ncbi:MAG: nickel pincer cofactor biosynthesis protein LarC [Haloarculaceae archaeon]
MRTLAFDGRMGASGDMLLGALVAAGADPSVLDSVEETLDVRYESRTVEKNGIESTAVDVLLADDHGARPDESHDHDHIEDDAHSHDHVEDHGHSHDHIEGDDNDYDHGHDHEHSHDHDHDHTHAEGSGPLRTYAEVVEIVRGMDLPAAVEADALAIFEILGEAEAAVHGTDLEGTHFHEVGADDAIADVVGAALLLDDRDVERVVTTPLSTGGGEVEMSHGTYPVPTPAVVEVAGRADWSLRGGPVDRELLTPTGAAILAHVADGVETLPTLDVETVGYGAGGYEFSAHPNVLRAIVGTTTGSLSREPIAVLETNLDDASPEVLGGLQESLAAVGARDVSVVPVTMKKSRPGHLVKVVVSPEDADRVARRLAAETGTLGVRETGTGHRWVARRRIETVELDVDGETYEVAVKVASDDDGVVFDVSAEYDDAASVAAETGRPVRTIIDRAESLAEP